MFARGYFPAGFFAPTYFPPATVVVPPAPTDVEQGGPGRIKWKPRRKIRRADYAQQEDYAQELAKAAMELALASVPISSITDAGRLIGDNPISDDELLLIAITRILH